MDELCIIGNILWTESCDARFSKKKYQRYVDHVKKCPICQQGLEMSLHNLELLSEKNRLTPE